MAIQIPRDFRRVIVAASVGNVSNDMTSMSLAAWPLLCQSSSLNNPTRSQLC
jgi:hypothetical protein